MDILFYGNVNMLKNLGSLVLRIFELRFKKIFFPAPLSMVSPDLSMLIF
jgi:hypothetical protein